MRSSTTVTLLLLITFAAAACPSGQTTCGTKGCYDPKAKSCPTDQSTQKLVLCGLGESACNGACFSPSQYTCSQGKLWTVKSTTKASPVVTSTTSSPKTSSTAKPSTSTVRASSSTPAASSSSCNSAGCGVGLCNCNGACFSPSEYNCGADLADSTKNVLCYGSLAACKGNCFDTTKQACVNGALQNIAQPTPTSASPTPAPSTATPVINPIPAPGAPYPKQTADLRIINSCKTTLWFEARYGNQGAPLPGQSTTALQAPPGAYIDYTIPDTGLAGSRFWAKYGCDSQGKNCAIGDQMQYWPNPPGGCPANGCTPPVDSLFEATWGCRPGSSCNSVNPTTWFDTSQVDGWTIPYKLTPNGDTSKCDCIGSQCGFNGVDASTLDLAKCPTGENLVTPDQSTANVLGKNVDLSSVDLRIIKNNQVLGCMSPCKRLNWGAPYGLQQEESSGSTMWMCCPTPTPESCSPANGCITPQVCRGGPIEKTKFVAAVHDMAPGVYSYSYDDGVGLHACPAGVATYTMEFCPSGSAQYPLQL